MLSWVMHLNMQIIGDVHEWPLFSPTVSSISVFLEDHTPLGIWSLSDVSAWKPDLSVFWFWSFSQPPPIQGALLGLFPSVAGDLPIPSHQHFCTLPACHGCDLSSLGHFSKLMPFCLSISNVLVKVNCWNNISLCPLKKSIKKRIQLFGNQVPVFMDKMINASRIRNVES